MEDHQFFNRERLLELSKLEFEVYAQLKELGKLPPREYINEKRTLLPDELAAEKLELLEEGFGSWTRSQFFHFVKASTKFGRHDYENIAVYMDMNLDVIKAYSDAFWQWGPTELKEDEWGRVKSQIEKGEQNIIKQKRQEALLEKFAKTFDDPANDMV
jgi:SWI/SNF-related matrix-associated actin-dependent regulator of chromatin subfamily A member 5